jgi:hypothetical protein
MGTVSGQRDRARGRRGGEVVTKEARTVQYITDEIDARLMEHLLPESRVEVLREVAAYCEIRAEREATNSPDEAAK